MPVVYADVVWLVNFVMDAALLAMSAWIAKRKPPVWRLALGALIGSMYAMLLFFPPLSTLTTWPGKTVVSLLMVWVAIPCRSWLDLARNSALYYLVAFVFAGAAIAMHYAIPGVSVAGGTVVGGKHLAYMTTARSLALLVALPTGAALIRYVVNHTKVIRKLHASLYQVVVTFGDASVSFTGLADTGNQLRHPLTGRPVCLVDLDVVHPLLPDGLSDALRAGMPVYDVMNTLSANLVARFTVVPFRAAGGTQSYALAFRPDGLVVVDEGVSREATVPCLLGIHVTPLSTDHRFQAILHIDVITGDDRFENDRPQDSQRQASHTAATVVDADPPEAFRRQ